MSQAERIRNVEDAARRTVGGLAGILIGFSFVALPDRALTQAETILLFASWAILGAAVVVTAVHELLMTRWVRPDPPLDSTVTAKKKDYSGHKLAFNVAALVLLVAGLTTIMLYVGLHIPHSPPQ